MSHHLIYDGVPNLSQINKTLPVNGAEYLLMEAPFQLQGLELGIDAFLQLNDPIVGYRYIPWADDRIYTNEVYKLPDWVTHIEDEVFLAITPSTPDYLKIYAVSHSNNFPVIEPPLIQGLIMRYYGGGELLHQEIHQGPIDFDWGNTPPQIIVDAQVGFDWEISLEGIFMPPSPPVTMAFYAHCELETPLQVNQERVTIKLNNIALINRFSGTEYLRRASSYGLCFLGIYSEFHEFKSAEEKYQFELTIKPTFDRAVYKYKLYYQALTEEADFNTPLPNYPQFNTSQLLIPASSFYHYITEPV